MNTAGHATPEGTQRYAERHDSAAIGHFRAHDELTISSIGLGTYLGDATPETDDAYEEAVRACLQGGINLIDTAINYRYQRSERNIGKALASLLEETERSRDEFLVASKGGFIPFDREEPEDPMEYIRTKYIEPGIVSPHDFTRNGNCIKPDYIEHQLNQSLENLGLECLDVFYVHNPETQLGENNREDVLSDLTATFERLESMVDAGKIARYGIATWDGLRVDPDESDYLDLESVTDCARQAGGNENHFEAVQLPLNLGMSEALTKANQTIEDEPLTPLEACRRLDLMIFTSASLLQGRLAKSLPDEIREDLNEFDSDVHRALQFARSAPGVTSALVGMKQPDHVAENLELIRKAPFPEEDFTNRFLREIPEGT